MDRACLSRRIEHDVVLLELFLQGGVRIGAAYAKSLQEYTKREDRPVVHVPRAETKHGQHPRTFSLASLGIGRIPVPVNYPSKWTTKKICHQEKVHHEEEDIYLRTRPHRILFFHLSRKVHVLSHLPQKPRLLLSFTLPSSKI
mmetsp:Transcript_32465/g.74611  ORF Transcript_32465/g.74611 Transcript_32465/m.74611 type:complete len:143 (+) Transcript_32465:1307-1735(+)